MLKTPAFPWTPMGFCARNLLTGIDTALTADAELRTIAEKRMTVFHIPTGACPAGIIGRMLSTPYSLQYF